MAPPRKTVQQYEAEAARVGTCLIHPSGRGAARRVFILRHGEIPSNMAVCHTCDNPRCIEDAHHFKGTWRDNVHDAVRKGRHSCFKNCAKPGEHHPFYGKKQTEEARQKIAAASRKMWDARKAQAAV
jgi:ribosomal protein S21